MNKKEQLEILGRLYEELKIIITTKGDDYAQDDDRLSNFKTSAAQCQLTPERSNFSLNVSLII